VRSDPTRDFADGRTVIAIAHDQDGAPLEEREIDAGRGQGSRGDRHRANDEEFGIAEDLGVHSPLE
jgi:hypothetical protein